MYTGVSGYLAISPRDPPEDPPGGCGALASLARVQVTMKGGMSVPFHDAYDRMAFLHQASFLLSSSSPALSRFYAYTMKRVSQASEAGQGWPPHICPPPPLPNEHTPPTRSSAPDPSSPPRSASFCALTPP